jgi:hypothetical protein
MVSEEGNGWTFVSFVGGGCSIYLKELRHTSEGTAVFHAENKTRHCLNVKRKAATLPEHNTERTVMCSELVVMGEKAGVTCCRNYSDMHLE